MFSQDYELRNDGQRGAVNETREGGGTVRIEWTYDALNRLTNENYNSSDNTKDYVAAFTFDLCGNRKQKTQTGAFQPATTTYTVNDRDQLTSEVTGGTTTNQTFDANGSLTVKGTESFGWDLRNRMKSATVAGVPTTYGYDSSGIRVREKTGADDVYYLTTNVNPTGYAQTVEQWKVGNPSADASYAWGRDLASQTRAGVTSYYVQDGLGSARALTNGTGVVTDTLDYAAYGKVVTRTGTTVNVYEFTGQHVDQRIGQSYNRARWHNLDGRWTSEDPAEFGPGVLADANQYLYAGANPATNVDPSGKFSLGEIMTSQGIGDIIKQGVGFTSKAIGAYNKVNRIIGLSDYATLIAEVAQAVYAPSPGVATQRIAELLKDKFGVVGFENLIGSGVSAAAEQIAGNWSKIGQAILDRSGEMAGKALPRVLGNRNFGNWLAAEAAGKLKFVFYLSSAPFGSPTPLAYVPVGKELDLAYSPGGGRLFGFGVRWGDRPDQVDQIMRVDYWDGRPGKGLIVHYHLLNDQRSEGHQREREIWPR